MASALRRPAPSSSIAEVSVATPGLLAGSPSPPVFTTRIMSTTAIGGVTVTGTGGGACAQPTASATMIEPVRRSRNADIAHLLHHEFGLAFGNDRQHDLGLAKVLARYTPHVIRIHRL